MASQLLSLILPGGEVVNPPAQLPKGGASEFAAISSNFITMFWVFGSIIALFFFIWAGIQWVSSGGDKQKIQAARLKITYAILGLLLMFLSFFIVSFIGTLFGGDIFG